MGDAEPSEHRPVLQPKPPRNQGFHEILAELARRVQSGDESDWFYRLWQ